MRKHQLIATCASGIEGIVGEELTRLGYETNVENGRVRFEGTDYDIARTNYWLRTADRIKINIAEFEDECFSEMK